MIKMLVLAAAAAFAAAPASAQDAPISYKVKYGDLDLASAHGSAALHARVDAAAGRICVAENAQGPANAFAVRRCRAKVVRAAQPQIAQAISNGGSRRIVTAARR